jgi:hypothetical protein
VIKEVPEKENSNFRRKKKSVMDGMTIEEREYYKSRFEKISENGRLNRKGMIKGSLRLAMRNLDFFFKKKKDDGILNSFSTGYPQHTIASLSSMNQTLEAMNSNINHSLDSIEFSDRRHPMLRDSSGITGNFTGRNLEGCDSLQNELTKSIGLTSDDIKV